MWRGAMCSSSQPAGSSAGGVLIAAYGIAAYVIFLLAFLYLIGFVADADFTVGSVHVVGKSIDRGGIGDGTLTVAAVVDRRSVARAVRGPAQRHGSARLQTLVDPHRAAQRRAVDVRPCLQHLSARSLRRMAPDHRDDVWRVTAQPWRALLIVTGLAGWAIVLLSTFLIDHFDLFGLRQVFARLRGRRLAEHEFTTPFSTGRSGTRSTWAF